MLLMQFSFGELILFTKVNTLKLYFLYFCIFLFNFAFDFGFLLVFCHVEMFALYFYCFIQMHSPYSDLNFEPCLDSLQHYFFNPENFYFV